MMLPSISFVLTCWLMMVLVTAERIPTLDDIKRVKKDDFVDPNDMFNYEPNGLKKINDKEFVKIDETNSEDMNKKYRKDSAKLPSEQISATEKVEKVCPAVVSDRPFYKQHIRSLLTHFTKKLDSENSQEEMSYELIVTLSKSDFNILQSFVNKESVSIQDVNSVLGQMIRRSKPLEEVFVSRWTFEDIFFGIQYKLAKEIMMIMILVITTICIGTRVQVSWRRLFGHIVMVCFIISIPWNWFHLYKVAVAKRQSEVIKGIPEECRPSDMSWQKSILGYFDSFITVKKGTCAEYHEKLQVDPFWEVSPPQAVAVSITKFILEPVTHIGESISKFFRSILLHVPPVMYPVVIGCTLVCLFFLLILTFGYRIRLPFFMGAIEPTKQEQTSSKEFVKAIESMKTEIIESVQHSMSSQNKLPAPAPTQPAAIESRPGVEDIGPLVKVVAELKHSLDTVKKQQQLYSVDKSSLNEPNYCAIDKPSSGLVENADDADNKRDTICDEDSNEECIDVIGAGDSLTN
ncbi:chloride channel CLIC-like protein 1 [Tubulanus polymorphus]|uniref:chloride channel CLIC-like protein 1 n=1 Tax=Tubulanus polymorphus TaxID=672921 RepID=UPI003DA3EF65